MNLTVTQWTKIAWVSALLAILAPASVLPATTNYYYVSTNGSTTLPYDTWDKAATNIQAAVDKASADLAPDTNCVVLVTNGAYTLTGQIAITNGITLRSVNGRAATFINGNYPAFSNRCVEITGNATLDGFTISNGYACGAAPSNYGGGIFVRGGIVNIWNCDILSNRAALATGLSGYGGGLAVTGATISVTNCLFAKNTSFVTDSAGFGGGIYASYNFGLIAHCVVSNNNVGSTLCYGGGIYARSAALTNLVVSNCTIIGNYARGGGGIYLYDAVATHCTIVSNRAGGDGAGGAWVTSAADAISGCKLFYSTIEGNYTTAAAGVGGVSVNRGSTYNCFILRNRGGSGGGVGMNHGYLENCLIAGNYATGKGGGVSRGSLLYADAKMVNCTIVRNRADGGGGGVSDASTGAARTNGCLNTIVYNNVSNATPDDIIFAGGVLDTLFGYSCSTNLTAGANGNITVDPRFTQSGSDYGTNAVLGDYTLQEGSPGIDKGTNGVATISVDLAGNRRISPSGGTIDMGAYEARPRAGMIVTIR